MLESSHQYHVAKSELAMHGVIASDVQLDLSKMLARKDKVVSQLTSGIAMLFQKKKVKGYNGRARLVEPDTVEVRNADTTLHLRARHIVLAAAAGGHHAGLNPMASSLVIARWHSAFLRSPNIW